MSRAGISLAEVEALRPVRGGGASTISLDDVEALRPGVGMAEPDHREPGDGEPDDLMRSFVGPTLPQRDPTADLYSRFGDTMQAPPDRGIFSNFGRGLSHGFVEQGPAAITGGPNAAHFMPTGEGVSGWIGETAGALAGGIANPAKAGENLLGYLTGAKAVQVAEPILGRVAAVAGPRVAGVLQHMIGGAGGAAPIGAVQKASEITPQQWAEDPLGALGEVAKAGGTAGAVGAGVGGVTGAFGKYHPSVPSTVPELIGAPLGAAEAGATARAATAAEGRQAGFDFAEAMDRGRASGVMAERPAPESPITLDDVQAFKPDPAATESAAVPEAPAGEVPRVVEQVQQPNEGVLGETANVVAQGKAPAAGSSIPEATPTLADLRREPMPILRRMAEELGIKEPGASKGKLIPRILDAIEERKLAREEEAVRAKEAEVERPKAEDVPPPAEEAVRDPDQVRPVADRVDEPPAVSPVETRVQEVVEADRPPAGTESGDVGAVEQKLETPPPPTRRQQLWELNEAAYIDRRLAERERAYQRSADAWEAQRAKTNPGALKRLRDIGIQQRANADAAERYRAAKLDPVHPVRTQLLKEYAEVVKKAISKGEPVPAEIIAQRPEFQKAADGRARYDKGRHTSFANESVAVDRTMQAERGYKAKRQDGTELKPAHRDEIAKSVADVEEAVGPLKDILRHSDLTIAHTNGKFPFMNSVAGGLYHPGERSITIGVEIGPFKQRAAAHELGHWLDIEAGRSNNKVTRVRTKSDKSIESFSAAEAAMDVFAKDKAAMADERALIDRATRSINDVQEVRKYFRTDLDKLEGEAKDHVRAEKFKLTAYWREPREVWARLFEQYVATKLGRGGPGMETPKAYEKMPGWWTKEEFAKLIPDIEKAIAQKIETLRARVPKVEETAEKVTPARESGETTPNIPKAPALSSEADLRRMPFKDLVAKAKELGIEDPGKSKGKLIPRVLEAERANANPGETISPSKTSGEVAKTEAGGRIPGETPESSPPKTLFDHLTAAADRVEESARKRIAKRTIPRGRNTGAAINPFAEVRDMAAIAAARAIKAGVKGGKALTELVRTLLKDDAPHLAEHLRPIRKAAAMLIKGSLDEKGNFSPEQFEMAVGGMLDARRTRKVGTVVREVTGQKDVSPGVEMTERQGLRRSLAERQRAAREGFKAGVEEGRAREAAVNAPKPLTVKQQIEQATGVRPVQDRTVTPKKALTAALRKAEQAGRAAYRLGRAEMRAEAKIQAKELRTNLLAKVAAEKFVAESFRKQAVRLAEEHLPLDVRGKVLRVVERATTPKRMAVAVERIEHELARSEGRAAAGQIKKLRGKGRMGSLTEERRSELRVATSQWSDDLKLVREGTPREAAEAAGRLTEQLRAAKEIYHTHKRENTVYFGELKRNAEEVRADVVKRIRTVRELKLGDVEGQYRRRFPGADLLQRVHLRNLSPENVAMMLDRDARGNGPVHKLVYQAFTDAEISRFQTLRDVYRDIETTVKKAGYKSLAEAQVATSDAYGRASMQTHDHTFADGQKATLNKGQVMGLVAMDPQTRARVLKSGVVFMPDAEGRVIRLGAEDFGAMEKLLTPQDHRVIAEVKQSFDAHLWDPMRKTVRRLKGWEPEKVPGYFPSKRNLAKSEKMPEGLKTGAAAIARYLENMGIVKDREGGTIPYSVTDFWSTVWDHVDNSTALIHYAEPVRSAELVLQHPDVRTEVAARLGQPVNRWVQDFLVDASMVEHPSKNVSKLIQKLGGNVGKSLTQTSWKSWMRNTLGVGTLWQELGTADLMAGIKGATKPGSFKRMVDASPYLWHRYFQQPFAAFTQVGDAPGMITGKEMGVVFRAALKSAGEGSPVEAVRVASRAFNAVRINNYFDSIPARVVWAATEHMANREIPGVKGAEREAWVNKRASEIMRRTLNTYSRFDRSGWAALADRHKFVTPLIMFTSDASKRYNQIVRTWRVAMQTGDAKPLAKTLLSSAAVVALSAVGIGVGGRYAEQKLGAIATGNDAGESRRRERAVTDAAWRFLQEAAGTAVFGDKAVQMVQTFTKLKTPTLEQDVLETPLGGAVDDILSAVSEVFKALDKVDDPLKNPKAATAADHFVKALGDAASGGATMAGIPAQPITGVVKNIRRGATASHVSDLMAERRDLGRINPARLDAGQKRRLAELDAWYEAIYSPLVQAANARKKKGDRAEAERLTARLEEATRRFVKRGDEAVAGR